MIYYNNKKIVRAFYDLKNVFLFEPQYFKNIGSSTMKYDLYEVDNVTGKVSSTEYSLAAGEKVEIICPNKVTDTYYGIRFYYPISTGTNYLKGVVFINDNAKTHYYEVYPLSAGQAMNTTPYNKYDEKPDNWDNSSSTTTPTLPTITTQPLTFYTFKSSDTVTVKRTHVNGSVETGSVSFGKGDPAEFISTQVDLSEYESYKLYMTNYPSIELLTLTEPTYVKRGIYQATRYQEVYNTVPDDITDNSEEYATLKLRIINKSSFIMATPSLHYGSSSSSLKFVYNLYNEHDLDGIDYTGRGPELTEHTKFQMYNVEAGEYGNYHVKVKPNNEIKLYVGYSGGTHQMSFCFYNGGTYNRTIIYDGKTYKMSQQLIDYTES